MVHTLGNLVLLSTHYFWNTRYILLLMQIMGDSVVPSIDVQL
jgi:hypothetical protein